MVVLRERGEMLSIGYEYKMRKGESLEDDGIKEGGMGHSG